MKKRFALYFTVGFMCLSSCSINGENGHLVSFNTDGGSAIEPQRIRDGGKIEKPADPEKEGHTFINWTYQGEEWSFLGYSVTSDMTLDANWSVNSYTLILENSMENAGVLSGAGTYVYGVDVTINASISFYEFDGWYDSNGNLLSNDATYTFSMGLDQTITAKWGELDQNKGKTLGAIPVIDEVNKTVTYGLYPQSVVSDSILSSSLNALAAETSYGYYLYNGEYYYKVAKANPYNSSSSFDNGDRISSGSTYWFKCEPITWNILSSNNGDYFLLSSVLLSCGVYDSGPYFNGVPSVSNRYSSSQIRSGLNDTFFKRAFALNSSYVKITEVDNSAATTVDNNENAGNYTKDKVFLLSYKDYLNMSYGFSSSTNSVESRKCKTTDYARACGASTTSSEHYGVYWTRSPCGSYDPRAVSTASVVNGYGGFGAQRVNDLTCCIRPAIVLSTEAQ